MQVKNELPFVSIVIPVLNEERFIIPLLESLGCLGGKKCLRYPHEIIVVDGGSTDRTLAILEELGEEAGIRTVNNPARIQSAGINLASQIVDPKAKYMVRIDAHAIYEPEFVENVVRALVATGAASVVVPLITRPHDPRGSFVWAVTAAQRSKLGNGGAAHRLESSPAQWVDHGHHAGFDLDFFRAAGGYDPSFVTNEDAEYDVRVAKAGGRIWLEPKAKVWYSPRETARTLARQYYLYGVGRASTVIKHRLTPKPRQMFPVAAFLANLGGLIGGIVNPVILTIPILYMVSCYLVIKRDRRKIAPHAAYRDYEAALAASIMHMSWATGFLRRLLVGPTR